MHNLRTEDTLTSPNVEPRVRSSEVRKGRTRLRSAAVTLADVAAQAGVSTVAASVALNDSPSRAKVSPATRERVREVARLLNYQPHAIARSLRLQRTNTIGLYNANGQMIDPSFPFHGALMTGLQTGCREHKMDLLVHGALSDMDETEVFTQLVNGKIDGLILIARTVSPLVELLVRNHFPVVTVVNEVPGIPCVQGDDTLGGEILARYLAEKHYRSVLYRHARHQPPTLQRRFDGFAAEARRHGITVMESDSGDHYDPTAEEQRLMGLPPNERPEVVAGYNDYTADGTIEHCQRAGLRVPKDIAVVGYDGLRAHHRPARKLTTIDSRTQQIAYEAFLLLLKLCNGEDVPMRTQLAPRLLAGDTA